MKLRIVHATEYCYADAVTDSVNEIRLSPCTDERQSCYQHAITIEPNALLYSYEDYFGNRVHAFSVNAPHRKLTIRTTMTVVTSAAVDGKQGVPMSVQEGWDWLANEDVQDNYAEYLLPSSYTTVTAEVLLYAAQKRQKPQDAAGRKEAEQFPPCAVQEWLAMLSERIRQDFVYDTEATNVQTKVADMIGTRRGVCQDFAHLMIAICRERGIPARYVSGYHFIGDLQEGSADFRHASHAWVEAYVPGQGWRGFDPTNEAPIGERYVKLGHGRDYGDIVPVKGVYRGTGIQELYVTVDVQRLEGA
ncbi:transglutaminase family protein [Paenibacillaceae bacterium]|nr:transglutaminase family protein [Paenibacillaceae bacterium]